MATNRKLATWAIALGALMVFSSLATPHARADDQAFFSQINLYGHPSVTQSRLLELGYQACGVRRSGQDSDAAKAALSQSLTAQGVVSSNAEIGTLVHVAVDTLCPEVGYP